MGGRRSVFGKDTSMAPLTKENMERFLTRFVAEGNVFLGRAPRKPDVSREVGELATVLATWADGVRRLWE